MNEEGVITGTCSFCETKIELLDKTHLHRVDGNYLYFHHVCWKKLIGLLNLTSVLESDVSKLIGKPEKLRQAVQLELI